MAESFTVVSLENKNVTSKLVNIYNNPLGICCPGCGSNDFNLVASEKKFGLFRSTFIKIKEGRHKSDILSTRMLWYSCKCCGNTEIYGD